jgi:hypothetical protein
LQTTEFFERHHNDAPANTALSVREFLAKKCALLLLKARYSPHSSLYGFYVFPELKSGIKGYHFQTLDSVQKAVTYTIEILIEADLSCYEAWEIRWAKFVASEGCYSMGKMLI